jgi:hypothetical protein
MDERSFSGLAAAGLPPVTQRCDIGKPTPPRWAPAKEVIAPRTTTATTPAVTLRLAEQRDDKRSNATTYPQLLKKDRPTRNSRKWGQGRLLDHWGDRMGRLADEPGARFEAKTGLSRGCAVLCDDKQLTA